MPRFTEYFTQLERTSTDFEFISNELSNPDLNSAIDLLFARNLRELKHPCSS